MLRGGARNFYGKVSIGHLHVWTPPNKRFQPTAFGAGMRGAFCLCFVLVSVVSLARVGGG